MIQVFVFGDSIAYGVGAERGWADLLKQSLRARMLNPEGQGEIYEFYNFAQPGAPIEFVIVTAIEQLKFYKRADKVIAITQVGVNNLKAEDSPDNVVNSLEESKQLMSQLLKKLKEYADEVIAVDLTPVDEAKTNPKPNPITGGNSYFQNDRIILFNHELMKLCRQYGVHHVDLTIDPKEWAAKYVSGDGLHPNGEGYGFVFEKIYRQIEILI